MIQNNNNNNCNNISNTIYHRLKMIVPRPSLSTLVKKVTRNYIPLSHLISSHLMSCHVMSSLVNNQCLVTLFLVTKCSTNIITLNTVIYNLNHHTFIPTINQEKRAIESKDTKLFPPKTKKVCVYLIYFCTNLLK